VVVSEDQGCRVVQQGLPQDLAGVNARAIDGAAEELLEGNEPMAVVEIQAAYLHLTDGGRRAATRDR
jgi:hypothetical protein